MTTKEKSSLTKEQRETFPAHLTSWKLEEVENVPPFPENGGRIESVVVMFVFTKMLHLAVHQKNVDVPKFSDLLLVIKPAPGSGNDDCLIGEASIPNADVLEGSKNTGELSTSMFELAEELDRWIQSAIVTSREKFEPHSLHFKWDFS